MENKEPEPVAEGWPSPESAKKGKEAATRGVKQRSLAGLSREQLREQLPERPPIDPEQLRERQKEFPPEGEIEFERSVIRIPFYLKTKGDEKLQQRKVDVMAFDAYMRLIRERPIRNGIGLRQFEFFIDAWELTNTFSRGLNANITFTLSDTVQPKSVCIAQQRETDFPAMIIYNAIYDVYLGKERILQNQPGTAFASPVWDIPPRNVTVAFEKPFESDLFSFSAGTCEGMRSINRDEFERGVTEALKVRGHF